MLGEWWSSEILTVVAGRLPDPDKSLSAMSIFQQARPPAASAGDCCCCCCLPDAVMISRTTQKAWSHWTSCQAVTEDLGHLSFAKALHVPWQHVLLHPLRSRCEDGDGRVWCRRMPWPSCCLWAWALPWLSGELSATAEVPLLCILLRALRVLPPAMRLLWVSLLCKDRRR